MTFGKEYYRDKIQNFKKNNLIYLSFDPYFCSIYIYLNYMLSRIPASSGGSDL